jgi:glutamyl-tRNA synthetase
LLTPEDFRNRLIPYLQSAGLISATASEKELQILSAAAPLIQERITVLSEAVSMLHFLFISSEALTIEEDALAGLPANSVAIVSAALAAINPIEDFKTESIQAALQGALIDGLGEKPRNAFGPVRTAISGRRVSPPLFESMELIGKAESIARLESFVRSR